MVPRLQRGFTWIELLVLLCVLAILVALALPSSGGSGLRRGEMTQTLSNLKQLTLATQQMALDGATSSNAALGWPGDSGGTFAGWTRQLLDGYLTTNDLCKLLSAPGIIVTPGNLSATNTTAVLVYAVNEKSPGTTVVFSSANFTNTPVGGLPPLRSAKPYGSKGFVVFRKAGDGAILHSRQAGNTNIVGSFEPLCR